jgi:hypothetical protein
MNTHKFEQSQGDIAGRFGGLGVQISQQDGVPKSSLRSTGHRRFMPDSNRATARAGKVPTHPWGIFCIKTANDRNYVAVAPPGELQHSLAKYRDELIGLLQGVVEHGTGPRGCAAAFAADQTATD